MNCVGRKLCCGQAYHHPDWQTAYYAPPLSRPLFMSLSLPHFLSLYPPSPKSQTVLWNIRSLCCVSHRWYLHLITQRAFLFLHHWDLWHMIGCWLFSLVSFADKIKLPMTWFMGVILHSRPISGGSCHAPCVSVCACVWQRESGSAKSALLNLEAKKQTNENWCLITLIKG